MGEEIFQAAEDAIKAAGSTDPRDAAEHHGIMVIDLKGTIPDNLSGALNM